jgi:hypothetical protein
MAVMPQLRKDFLRDLPSHGFALLLRNVIREENVRVFLVQGERINLDHLLFVDELFQHAGGGTAGTTSTESKGALIIPPINGAAMFSAGAKVPAPARAPIEVNAGARISLWLF